MSCGEINPKLFFARNILFDSGASGENRSVLFVRRCKTNVRQAAHKPFVCVAVSGIMTKKVHQCNIYHLISGCTAQETYNRTWISFPISRTSTPYISRKTRMRNFSIRSMNVFDVLMTDCESTIVSLECTKMDVFYRSPPRFRLFLAISRTANIVKYLSSHCMRHLFDMLDPARTHSRSRLGAEFSFFRGIILCVWAGGMELTLLLSLGLMRIC